MNEQHVLQHMEEQPEVCMTPEGVEASAGLGWGPRRRAETVGQPSDCCRCAAQRWQQGQKNMAGNRPGWEPSRGPGGNVREGLGVLLSTTDKRSRPPSSPGFCLKLSPCMGEGERGSTSRPWGLAGAVSTWECARVVHSVLWVLSALATERSFLSPGMTGWRCRGRNSRAEPGSDPSPKCGD